MPDDDNLDEAPTEQVSDITLDAPTDSPAVLREKLSAVLGRP